MVNNPKYATAVGLLFYGAENEGMTEQIYTETSNDSNMFGKLLNHMKKWFSEIKQDYSGNRRHYGNFNPY